MISLKVHKVSKFVKFSLTLGTFYFINFSLCFCQNHKIDSLTIALKTAHADTNKVNTLNALALELKKREKFTKIDSVAKLALKLAESLQFQRGIANAIGILGNSYYHQGNYDTSLMYCNKALEIDKKAGFRKNEISVLNNIGNVYNDQANYPEALDYYNKAMEMLDTAKDRKRIADILNNIGNVYESKGDHPKALLQYLKALKIYEILKDTGGEAVLNNGIGNVYSSQKDFQNSLVSHLKALALYQDLNNKGGESTALSNIGGLYNEKGDFEKALDYYLQALKLAEDIGDKRGTTMILNNSGSVYSSLNNYSKAKEQFLRSLKLGEEIGDKIHLSSTYSNLCGVYLKLNDNKNALENAKKALELGNQSASLTEILYAEQALSDVYAAMGDGLNAMEHYRKYVAAKDSMYNNENTKKIVQSQMNYDFDKKQAIEKAEQDKKDLITEDNSKRQKLTILFMALIALAVGIIAVVILRSLRITRKQKNLIEQQKLVVEEQKLLVEQQKAIVDEKNKDITDSIHYASRIQRALLTTDDFIGKRLKEYFILFKPRDIVSGDFYWANEVETNAGKSFLICAGDCTGHGVPGAFMSLLNISLLNEVNIEKSIHEPHAILDDVREHIIKALNPEGLSTGSQDGMDCVLCSFDLTSYMLSFACANNPLWIIRGTELIESKADKMPVGIQEGYRPFSSQSVQLQKGDVVYIFTDGYADQFGGPKGKKFKYKQLQELLLANAHRPIAEQKDLLALTIENWKGELEQVDDILIIGIRV